MPSPKHIVTILVVALVGFAIAARIGAGRKLLGL